MHSTPHIGQYNLHDFLFGEQGSNFLYMVVFRTLAMFIVILFTMRILGKRGVKQLSVYELILILMLGSAAGDPALYNQVGFVDCVLAFIIIVLLYRLTISIATRSHRFTILIKGQPVYLIQDGRFCNENFRQQPIAFDEFFAELRLRGVSQLGQVESSIIETSGELSLFFYPDDKIKRGLPIMPAHLAKASREIKEADYYACVKCTDTVFLEPGSPKCKSCGVEMWVKASNEARVQ